MKKTKKTLSKIKWNKASIYVGLNVNSCQPTYMRVMQKFALIYYKKHKFRKIITKGCTHAAIQLCHPSLGGILLPNFQYYLARGGCGKRTERGEREPSSTLDDRQYA